MVYIEIDKKNYHNLIKKLNEYLSNKETKVFILFYMEGCGPCNATRPEWSKLKNVLSDDFLNNENAIIASIDKDLFSKLKNIKNEPMSFPTMRFITNAGEKSETYEDSEISNKDRTIDSFIEWIKLKTGKNEITINKRTKKINEYSNKKTKKIGGKWSLKYKRKINCKNPKGFSQRQYCKYGRKNKKKGVKGY